MNEQMAYLLGMIVGNGEIKRGNYETTVIIEIPHKKLKTEFQSDVGIYIKASITDIRSIIEPLIGAGIKFRQSHNVSYLSFVKPNEEYTMREILKFVGNAVNHTNMRISQDIYFFTKDEREAFVRGFADVTGYIRRSNAYYKKTEHRVYFEIPQNWELVAEFCNVLKSLDIPVQNIDWGHPNIRDGRLTKYNQGNHDFWKKEHQVKVWALEYDKVGFGIIHKQEALDYFSKEHRDSFACYDDKEKRIRRLHRYYWELNGRMIKKQYHPGENDASLPSEIKGKHFDSWREIADVFGYNKES